MAVTYTIDGGAIDSVDIDSVELVETAIAGQTGTGKLTIDDAAGNIATVGFKDVSVTEDDCSASLLQSGFVGTRTIRRGTYRTGASRKIDLNVLDLNDLLNRRVIRAADGKRPAEKMSVRLHWLLGSEYLSGLVADNGFVDYPAIELDKNDYTNSRPGDVLGDMAVQGEGRNFFVYADPATGDPSLWFRDSATSSDFSSTLKISNDLADVDNLTTFPSRLTEMTLEREPDQVFSRAAVPYARGTVYEVKASTASTFVERDGVAPTSSIKTAAKASKIAKRFLNDHDHEADTVTDSILVPSSRSGLIHAGMRLQAKYTHTVPEGYDSFTWYRVLERRLSHVISPGGIPEAPGEPLYKIGLRMIPQEVSVVSSCPYETTATSDYYPLGRVGDGWGVEVSPKPSDGVVYYLRPGFYYPIVPTPGWIGGPLGTNWTWGFPLYGVGGPGSIDFAGDCVYNTLQFIVVGPGTLTLQSEIFEGSTRPMAASWGESPNAYTNYAGAFTSGESFDITVTGDCVNLIRIGDGQNFICGGKWGWSSAHWEAA